MFALPMHTNVQWQYTLNIIDFIENDILFAYWRMIHTLESDEIEIIAFVLDIIDHDDYNKKFGFRKR